MLKSSRGSLGFLAGVVAWLLLSSGLHAAGPVNSLTVGAGGPYTAGTSIASGITVIVYAGVTDVPDAGQVISLELLNGSDVLTGGMSPTSFVTDGVNTIYSIPGSFGDIDPVTFFTASSTPLTFRVRTQSGGVSDTTNVTVNPGLAAKLVVFAPGQTLLPGHDLSVNPFPVSGSVTPQEPGQLFQVTVQLTDAYFNPISRADNVSLTASGGLIVPSNQTGSLGANGQKQFDFTLEAPRIERVITVTDTDDGGVSQGQLTVKAAGPPAEEVFPFPNPFNPHTGSMTFRVGIDSPKNVTLKIVDPFGQPVWERSMSVPLGDSEFTWDGRNDNGQTVAAGFYYVLLDIGGSIKSKKKIGVVK